MSGSVVDLDFNVKSTTFSREGPIFNCLLNVLSYDMLLNFLLFFQEALRITVVNLPRYNETLVSFLRRSCDSFTDLPSGNMKHYVVKLNKW